ncbi:MAG: formate C-acetyltransferase [Bacilli bacterium]|nr:formate C-acetyltransferase [Bacilli bacterium]MDD4608283.1 formate C-acetyltransferase [Bacilli bacterium]
MNELWKEFLPGIWQQKVNVSDFIKNNYTEYLGDDSFLKPISFKTKKVWDRCLELLSEEREKGVLDIEVNKMSGINNFEPGYIDKDNEVIVGLQTDYPLKRIVNPYGGIRVVNNSLKAYGYTLNKDLDKYFNEFRKTHNQGVFDVYTPDIRMARSNGLITGLPDAYGRGRIIGDYRRIALYGVDYLIEDKKRDLQSLKGLMLDELIRQREEVSEQIRALEEVKKMALSYGIDISKPATNAKEATQFVYFGYLAGTKENNGAATSLGRTSTFLDIYIERDLKNNVITEEEAQEIIDQFIIKLRMIRHLRTPQYNELFAGDPTWVTESLGGMTNEGKSLVTKTSFRYLHTLINLGSAPEPNMTILWSKDLPRNWKEYCSKISIKTDSIQYENDDLMRPIYGDDYAIACCVSAMTLGKQMQFFGARSNLAKALLYAINGGVDEQSKKLVIEGLEPITDEILDYDKVIEKYDEVLERVAETYVNALNIIHYMHDKYAYEASQMALHDTKVERLMAFGIAGLSVVVDSLSAIKYATVKPIYDEDGLAIDFEVIGDYPKYGNDDDRADEIAVKLTDEFANKLRKHPLYRDAKHTLSILTITSNVVYGKATGTTPDGRKSGEPFAPGANPMHQRDLAGVLASLNSVAKIKYSCSCEDGVSNTLSIVPSTLGKTEDEQINNLVSILDGYIIQGGHHLNINVLNRELLIDAMNNPEKYPLLTIRVSGYAVNFNKLTKDQQMEVISRTFHDKL